MKKLIHLLVALAAFNLQAQTEGYSPNVDGSQTFYKIYGKGEPLLVINGGPGMNSNGFEALAKKLGEKYLIILYDQRGTGKSTLKELNSETINMKHMGEDIESLRKHLKIDKWSILGHSFGGIMAAHYATIYPENISKIVFSASGGIDLGLTKYASANIHSKLTKTERDSLAYYDAKIDNGDTSKKTQLGRGRALAPAYLYDKKYVPILAERLTQGNSTINGLVWNDLQKIKFDCKPKLKNFNQPVLIIQGKQDVIKPETAEIAHSVLKNSKVIYLDNCGHYGWLDAEEEYFKALFDFLKS
ncbi:alpha/beta hydrolase [Flavobacterium amniphilum]|uniref:alpha/beta fold hydrolase n=1 Tax=Flavobacterium amniphilum TaxID=1834035 RepID=UPI00202AA14E|nr:alpha/beta hydrolase [Flavobacterium amniphilum]MCL9806002.1 alpha/beta hydrolase [Flavobacterium amniphilum]